MLCIWIGREGGRGTTFTVKAEEEDGVGLSLAYSILSTGNVYILVHSI